MILEARRYSAKQPPPARYANAAHCSAGLYDGRAAGAGMAFLVLQAAAARTGLVATDLRHVSHRPQTLL
jgi:hypothetical protein